jgi:hypothetical protein
MAIGVKVPHRMKPKNEPPSVKMKIRSFSPKGLLLGLLTTICRKGKKEKRRRTKTTTMAIGFEAPHRMIKPDQ